MIQSFLVNLAITSTVPRLTLLSTLKSITLSSSTRLICIQTCRVCYQKQTRTSHALFYPFAPLNLSASHHLTLPDIRFNSSSATIIPERESDLRSTSITAANALASLDSARVLMPQDTLGRELDGWITGGGNESAVESQEIDFANAVSGLLHGHA